MTNIAFRIKLIVSAALTAAIAAGAARAGEPAPLDLQMQAYKAPWKRYSGWPSDQWTTFNTLAAMTGPPPPNEGAVREIGGAITGNIEKGMQLAFDRRRGGSCVACHVMGPKTPELPGDVGPDLSEIGTQGRTDEHLFNYVYDARVYNPQTVMPPWGAHGIFTDEEIRDIVAFLKSLTTPTNFADPLDNPVRRPVPVEDRDNLDEFVNPAMNAVDMATALWAKAGPAGKSCKDCHAEPETAFNGWAARMPRFEKRLGKIIGVEEFVARHAAATTGEAILMETPENVAYSVYLRHLANGAEIDVDTESKDAKAALDRGSALTQRKIGQLNFACIDCHQISEGKWIRGQWLGPSRGQLQHFPTWRTSRNEIWDIRKRFQWCGVAIRADELPPDAAEYGDLELWLAAQNEGLKLNAPGIRH